MKSNKNWEKLYIERGRYYLQPHESLKRLIFRLKELDLQTVVDLGCGSGRNIIPMAQAGFNVTGIDFSPSAVDLAQKWIASKSLNAYVYLSDIHEKIKFIKDSSIDCVMAINSLHYTDFLEFRETLNEVNRILVTGGIFLLILPSEKAPIDDIEHTQIYFKEEQIKDLLQEKFRILELSKDRRNHFVVIAQEK